jgi:hypothetical protein
MALVSPGVEVTVIDESFYTPAEPGTTPLIVVATAQNKSNAAGTGTAAGTTQANASKVFRITSQRELVDTFGVPFFEKTASSTPIHGSERNEYGLLAAYSFLGVSNSAFIMRADVDLDQLEPQTTAPGAEPTDGQWWFDTRGTTYGIQEWNGAAATTVGGQKFTYKAPIVLTDDDVSKVDQSSFEPKGSVGSVGDYAIVALTTTGTGSFVAGNEQIKVYYKSAGNGAIAGGGTAVTAGEWVLVGSQKWTASHPTITGTSSVSTLAAANTYYINGTLVTTQTSLDLHVAHINGLGIEGVTAAKVNNRLYLYSDGETLGGGDSSLANSITIAGGGTNSATAFTQLGLTAGAYYGPALQQTPHTSVPAYKTTDSAPRPTGSVWIKTTEPNFGARFIVNRWNSATKTWIEYSAPLYASTHAASYFLDRSGGGVNIPANSIFVQTNADEESGFDTTPGTASFRLWKRAAGGATSITSGVIADNTFGSVTNTFTVYQSVKGSATLYSAEISFTTTSSGTDDAEAFAAAIANANFGFTNTTPPVAIPNNLTASITDRNEVVLTHTLGGDIRFVDGTGTPIADAFTPFNLGTGFGTANFYAAPSGSAVDYLATGWAPLAIDTFAASADQPLNEPTDGQLWYNPNFGEVDIMIHNGTIWVGYQDATSGYSGTDANGPIVAATMPEKQSNGTSNLVDGDLWISTADLENFPTIYRFNTTAGTTVSERWVLVDKADQTTEEGVLFADARYGDSGATGDEAATIKDLLVSNYVDPDCPDPVLYPKGMLLWNLRRSGGNVKRYANSYINTAEKNVRFELAYNSVGDAPVLGDSMTTYATDRWVTASPNNEDGSGSFGRKAQRSLVVQRIKSALDTSSEARDEERRNFNLIAAPGYPEALSNLINLNIDRGLTAFVVGDTPFRLPSDATSLTAWGTNANSALDNNDVGIVSYDEYAAVWYPNGFTTDLGGANAVVPASHMMLRTIALSDQVSYPWFAPAGTRRGGITNATAVGYIDSLTGEFQSVALNEGQRDTLYDLKVNPIPFFVGVGLVAYGQKTRARNASALDRINVARLVVYLRSQLNKLARPYIFEPNDKITRDEIKGAVESLLLELVGLRALYDFAVVCDESNNTPSRIDRNELYVDVAIEPTKAVEFIYIPLRIKNTGEI